MVLIELTVDVGNDVSAKNLIGCAWSKIFQVRSTDGVG